MDGDVSDDGPEALEWLGRTPPPEGVVWDNYLHEPPEVARLVRELYALGSPRVFVPEAFIDRPGSTPWRDDRPETAKAIGVHLPASVEARWAVLDSLADRAGVAGQMPPSCARRYAEAGGIVLVAHIS